MADRDDLTRLLQGILSGTAELGLASLPALAAFGKYRHEKGWKEAGLRSWLKNDPQALVTLAQIVQEGADKIPPDTKNMLIVALGGVPQPTEV